MSKKEPLSKVKRFKELQLSIKQLEAEAESVKSVIVAEMDKAKTDEMVVDVFTVRHTAVTSNKFDTTAFKKTHIDLYSQYTKEVVSKRFSIV